MIGHARDCCGLVGVVDSCFWRAAKGRYSWHLALAEPPSHIRSAFRVFTCSVICEGVGRTDTDISLGPAILHAPKPPWETNVQSLALALFQGSSPATRRLRYNARKPTRLVLLHGSLSRPLPIVVAVAVPPKASCAPAHPTPILHLHRVLQDHEAAHHAQIPRHHESLRKV